MLHAKNNWGEKNNSVSYKTWHLCSSLDCFELEQEACCITVYGLAVMCKGMMWNKTWVFSVKIFLKKPWCNWGVSLTLTQHLWSYFEAEHSALTYFMPLVLGSVPSIAKLLRSWKHKRDLVSSQELQASDYAQVWSKANGLPSLHSWVFLVVMTPFKSTWTSKW